MSFFATIHDEAGRRQLRFLVIGGLAVNHYGYSRETGDLDLFVGHADRDRWLAMFSSFGYAIYHDGGSFIQFAPPEQNAWPVDLMFVQEGTFRPMFEASVEANLYGVPTRVPTLVHLLALKLHALKHTRMHRFLKDYLDVERLIRANQLDIGSEKMRALFAKYGTMELYGQISRSLGSV